MGPDGSHTQAANQPSQQWQHHRSSDQESHEEWEQNPGVATALGDPTAKVGAGTETPALLPAQEEQGGNTGRGSDMQQGGSEAKCPQDEFKCQNHNNNNN